MTSLFGNEKSLKGILMALEPIDEVKLKQVILFDESPS